MNNGSDQQVWANHLCGISTEGFTQLWCALAGQSWVAQSLAFQRLCGFLSDSVWLQKSM